MAIWANYLFIYLLTSLIQELRLLVPVVTLRSLTNIKTYKHNSFWSF